MCDQVCPDIVYIWVKLSFVIFILNFNNQSAFKWLPIECNCDVSDIIFLFEDKEFVNVRDQLCFIKIMRYIKIYNICLKYLWNMIKGIYQIEYFFQVCRWPIN